MKNDFAFIGGIFLSLMLILVLYAWASREAPINELTCTRKGVSGTTTMHELRKPGPYVIVEQKDGDTIAIPKDGIRCVR